MEQPSNNPQIRAAGLAGIKGSVDPDWAWAVYEPDNQRPWTPALAGHLHRRAAFGASWGQLKQTIEEGPQKTISRLLMPESDPAAFNSRYDEFEASASDSPGSVCAWWLRRMIDTPHPLLEKMTLFWHSHFAISNARVNNGRLMQQHVRMLRRQALGRFDSLLKSITSDPAVFIGLEAEANRKALPNENLARILLQVFIVGPKSVSEVDVQEAARSLTGWFVFKDQLRFIPREHDDTPKSILGQRGDFGINDVARIALQHPDTPQRIARELYRWLISETVEPDSALIDPLAASFAKNYEILALVEKMLRSNQFFSAVAYQRRIKCPVEFALGIIRGLEGTVPTEQLGRDLAEMGQDLYSPATVNGWPGGGHWIHSATMIQRHNLAMALLNSDGPYGGRLNPRAVASKYGHAPVKEVVKFLADLFLQGEVDVSTRESLMGWASETPGASDTDSASRQAAYAITTQPAFHLA